MMEIFRLGVLLVFYWAIYGGALLILNGVDVVVSPQLTAGLAIYSALAAFILWTRIPG